MSAIAKRHAACPGAVFFECAASARDRGDREEMRRYALEGRQYQKRYIEAAAKALDDMFSVTCEHCGGTHPVAECLTDEGVQCPSCKIVFRRKA